MSWGLISSTRAHLSKFGSGSRSRDGTQESSNTLKSATEIQHEFPDAKFLAAFRSHNYSPKSHRLPTPKTGFMRFSSTYKHNHNAEIKDLVQTFVDEFAEEGEKTIEGCEREIELGSEVEELVDSVGRTSAGRGGCCSLHLPRPELGVKIHLDIQTQTLTTRFPLRKAKETQIVCLALETLPPHSSQSPFSSPSSPASLSFNNDIDFHNVISSTPSTPTKGSPRNPNANGKETGKGKVYICYQQHTARVAGLSFFWGCDFKTSFASHQPRGNGDGSKKGNRCWERMMRGVGLGESGRSGRESLKNENGRENFSVKRGRREAEQELKPLLFV